MAALSPFFATYAADNYRPLKPLGVDICIVDKKTRSITLTASESFCSQPFTPEVVDKIYSDIQNFLPKHYSKFKLSIVNKTGRSIEHHISNIYNRPSKIDPIREWKSHYKGVPWVSNISRPYILKNGLAGRHLFLSPSHGKVFRNGKWRWQRPNLFCTIEDLYTASLAIPYLLPMLENAGAVVTTSRERDYQIHELITNPTTQPNGALAWQPHFPERGQYAVYVSYESRANSATNAHYIVHHLGGATHFRVNQQMGGGIWVYLGTFTFAEGDNDNCRVELIGDKETNGSITGS